MGAILLGMLAVVSVAITLWQWMVARCFPLHARVGSSGFAPPVTILKPLSGADTESRGCLESWFTQDYAGPTQILFGVTSTQDPICPLISQLIAAHPQRNAHLIACGEPLGANSKVSALAQLQRHARHDVVVVSDADVWVPSDFLVNVVAPLHDHRVGLVNCLYRLANPTRPAMQWEAIAINADFWSQVLQARSLRTLDFALGAAMATRRKELDSIGGFAALADCLADDYQLGNRIARRGGRIVISPVVVECREAPKNWRQVWKHQLRWARTIRFCQPVPYFFSILGNATVWPLLWLFSELSSIRTTAIHSPSGSEFHLSTAQVVAAVVAFLTVRVLIAVNLQSRLNRSGEHRAWFWLVPIKDLLGATIWMLSFFGNRVEWRGQCYRVHTGGKLAPLPISRKDNETT